jgi:hypothetical protein
LYNKSRGQYSTRRWISVYFTKRLGLLIQNPLSRSPYFLFNN